MEMEDEIEELEQQYFERQAASEQQMIAEGHPMVVQGVDGMSEDYYEPEGLPQQQYYPLSLAQGVLPAAMGPTGPVAPAQPATPGNLLTNRYAGVPGWGWGLITIGVLGGGYLLYKQGSKPTPNDGEEKGDDDLPSLPASTESSGWSPSRSRFGEQLSKFVSTRGVSTKDMKIYIDADDAKKYCKPVSPLVTIKLSPNTKLPMADVEKFCKREGLMCTDHGNGIVGFYPATSGKKARQWEDYVEALRDEGQTI